MHEQPEGNEGQSDPEDAPALEGHQRVLVHAVLAVLRAAEQVRLCAARDRALKSQQQDADTP